MKRQGSSKHHFAKRVRSDAKARMVGMKLAIPIGEETAFITKTNKTEMIRISLRSSYPHKVKQRQADLSFGGPYPPIFCNGAS